MSLEFDAAAFEDLAWWVSIGSCIRCNLAKFESWPADTTTGDWFRRAIVSMPAPSPRGKTTLVPNAFRNTVHHPSDALCIIMCYTQTMTISLRNLPPEVEKAILETSHREGISLNKATLRLLEASLRKSAKNSDFEEFFGTWARADAEAFDAALAEMRQVEPADWESAG